MSEEREPLLTAANRLVCEALELLDRARKDVQRGEDVLCEAIAVRRKIMADKSLATIPEGSTNG